MTWRQLKDISRLNIWNRYTTCISVISIWQIEHLEQVHYMHLCYFYLAKCLASFRKVSNGRDSSRSDIPPSFTFIWSCFSTWSDHLFVREFSSVLDLFTFKSELYLWKRFLFFELIKCSLFMMQQEFDVKTAQICQTYIFKQASLCLLLDIEMEVEKAARSLLNILISCTHPQCKWVVGLD